jgi:transcription elongation GreA/GreB family factor
VIVAGLERERAEQLLANLDRELGLEEHRKVHLRRIVLQKHPELRQTDDQPLYTTASGLERKRVEFEQITKQDLPRNAEEIRKAAAHGDLRENFEYKAAREKHEMLSSRAKSLHDELRRARAIDPATIDASRVRVGTRVVLEPADGGDARTLVILGPWDSDPARGVVSYLAPAVQALLGKAPGEPVSFLESRYIVRSIDVWREG